jgi:signal transduction histidine kinase
VDLPRGLPRRSELVAAVLVAATGLGEVWVPFSSRQGVGSGPASTVGVVLAALGMLWWRRAPVPVLALVMGEWAVVALVAPPYTLFYGTFVPFLLLMFSGARWGTGRSPAYVAGLGAATLLSIDLLVPTLQEPGEIVFHWAVTALVWSAGYGLRVWERRTRTALERAVRAEREAAEQAFRAVLDERARISRELHDIVTHAVSSIVVQAGAAEQAVEDDPTFTRAALGHIRSTGNEALGEMRRLVAMLRAQGDAPLAPQPRLDGLDELVARSSAAGPRTELRVTGAVRPLPAGLDLAVYRIVQEALTNVRRHAAADSCEICVDYGTDALTVRVVDDGTPSGTRSSGGHGLVGMRERVALYGGELSTGPLPERGYRVEARLPLA